MLNNPQALRDWLQRLNLEVRHEVELAEASIASANELIGQVATLKLVNDKGLVGDIILQRSYGDAGPHYSSQVIQAALFLPGGIGALFWDSEELYDYLQQPQPDPDSLFVGFVPFDRCEPAVKALLGGQLERLLER